MGTETMIEVPAGIGITPADWGKYQWLRTAVEHFDNYPDEARLAPWRPTRSDRAIVALVSAVEKLAAAYDDLWGSYSGRSNEAAESEPEPDATFTIPDGGALVTMPNGSPLHTVLALLESEPRMDNLACSSTVQGGSVIVAIGGQAG